MNRFSNPCCSRRTAIKIGTLGFGLGLGDYFRLANASETRSTDRSAVLVFLKGGPSHQDTFDMKPDAPAEYRGEFRPIRTNVPGIEICEHLPRLANCADQYSILRGISHNLADHSIGTSYLLTGNRPTPTVQYPMYGSVVSHQHAAVRDIPSFVSIDRPLGGPGFLGPEYGPLSTGEKPQHGLPFRVRGISLDDGLSIERYRSRAALAEDFDTLFRGVESLDDQVRSMDRFQRQAFDLISSPRCRDAMDLAKEPESETQRFGKHEFGQSLMMTARLVEAGVRFVTVILEDWDTHQENFNELGGRLLPPLDQGLSAFLDRLNQRGMLQSTTVLVTGEFGRTPKINNKAGRDHWARAMTSILAGAGVSTGQVVGETNDKAEEPVGTGFTPDDLAATFYSALGIDPKMEFDSNVGRPITLVRDGKPISRILS
ncbi:hypothetical protein Mal15_56680 [Stieleria maiorica]|uniref:DUF1501 domain-containing protein n=1 Tax=Stieleria maiorica TaxID=2795974 RepID=A0A5B9MNE8_9BACT|nr:DUF1501 domain-containing protein [Stieleria maiorica]QEG01591.1 hypothetical protein Mal15_56680 [Stieleria maiorica]